MRFEVRFHGRGGQGVVTAAELLSLAAFDQGEHAQAIPSFGSERTGAPVVAYCRISDRPIRSHDPITTPDAVVVQDPTMLAPGRGPRRPRRRRRGAREQLAHRRASSGSPGPGCRVRDRPRHRPGPPCGSADRCPTPPCSAPSRG